MKLLEDWKLLVKRAWSVRLALLATVLSAAEVAVQIWAPSAGGRFAVLAGMVSLAAGVARLLAQPAMRSDK